jgi:hypothetical protein
LGVLADSEEIAVEELVLLGYSKGYTNLVAM